VLSAAMATSGRSAARRLRRIRLIAYSTLQAVSNQVPLATEVVVCEELGFRAI